MRKHIIYYKPVTYTTVSKNSWRFGGYAVTQFRSGEHEKWFDLEQFGKTQQEAIDKLMNFLSSNGKIETKEVTP